MTSNSSLPQPVYRIQVWHNGNLYEFFDRSNQKQQFRDLGPNDVVRVGAHPHNELRLSGEEIAQHHAILTYDPNGVAVRRIAARKGVILGQTPLTPWAATLDIWHPGEQLQIGPYELRVSEQPAAGVGASSPPTGDGGNAPATALASAQSLSHGLVRLALEARDQPPRLMPGQPDRWRLLLQNTDKAQHTFVFEFATTPPLAADWIVRQPAVVARSGELLALDLEVYAQRIAANQAGRYILTLIARSATDETIAARLQQEILVGAYTQPLLLGVRPDFASRNKVRYSVRMSNPTNTILSYRLKAADGQAGRDDLKCTFFAPGDASASVAQNSVVVQPGATETLGLVAQLRSGAQLAQASYTLEVTATAPGQAPTMVRVPFRPRWVTGQVDTRALSRRMLWISLAILLLIMLIGVSLLLRSAVDYEIAEAAAKFNIQASAHLAEQMTAIQTSQAGNATAMAETAGPLQTATASLAETARAIDQSATKSAETVVAIASIATTGAQAVPTQLAGTALAEQGLATQVAAAAAATAQVDQGKQTAAAAPVQTIMAAETAKVIAGQNAAAADAAAAQSTSLAAAQTSAAAATIIANDTKPVRLAFVQKPSYADPTTGALNPVQVKLQDKTDRTTTRDGYLIVLSLECNKYQLNGIRAQSSVQGIATFADLSIVSSSTSTQAQRPKCKLVASEINNSLPPVKSDQFE